MTAEDIIYKLYEFFKVNNNLDLAELLKTTPQTISNWKTRNSISAIKKKCRELGIYNQIFKDFEEDMFNDLKFSDFDKIKTLKQQCKKYGIQTTTIKNLRLLYLFQELEKHPYPNEELEKILKGLLLTTNTLFSGLDENSKNIIFENLEKEIEKFEKENS
ncbi:helix-turn-helix domain containing protein [Aliarcobacter cryaerophilus]|uniref:helix-turn-helix domain-containing protein n=1 Tax=Aliarcobacter cryaerophilus TaxID=28198 RepID=UPI003DA6C920